jgi:hypothetical protein
MRDPFLSVAFGVTVWQPGSQRGMFAGSVRSAKTRSTEAGMVARRVKERGGMATKLIARPSCVLCSSGRGRRRIMD